MYCKSSWDHTFPCQLTKPVSELTEQKTTRVLQSRALFAEFHIYLAMLSQTPWPPYFAGSTGAPAFLTMILRINRLPFIPAASNLRWISSERLNRKASASLGYKEMYMCKREQLHVCFQFLETLFFSLFLLEVLCTNILLYKHTLWILDWYSTFSSWFAQGKSSTISEYCN